MDDEKLNPYEQYNSMTLSYERFACQGFLKKFGQPKDEKSKIVKFFKGDEYQTYKRYF